MKVKITISYGTDCSDLQATLKYLGGAGMSKRKLSQKLLTPQALQPLSFHGLLIYALAHSLN